jgi:tetrahydromethanopterin S-methyltransferase subunit C
VIPPFTACPVAADDQDTGLSLKLLSDYLAAEIPSLGNIGHAVVALLVAWEWAFLRFVRSRTA